MGLYLAHKIIYPDSDGGVVVICSACGRQCTFPAAVFPPQSSRARVRCVCGYTEKMAIERRRNTRIPIALLGRYVKAGTPTMAGDMVIEDLSLEGLRFSPKATPYFRVGDDITVGFSLDRGSESYLLGIDDRMRSNIVKAGTVQWTSEHAVGAKFRDPWAYASLLKTFLDHLRDS